MTPVEAFKPVGVFTIIALWLAIGLLVYKWRGNRAMSISKHAASHKTAYIMMLIIETILLPIFFFFILFWFTPTFGMPTLFTAIVGLVILGLLVAAWVPDTSGWKSKVHGLSSYGAATLFVPAATLMCASPKLPALTRILSYAGLAYFVFTISLFSSFEGARKYHLYFQALYFALFDAALISAIILA